MAENLPAKVPSRSHSGGTIVKYKSEFNNLNLTKLNPMEHNVFFTLLATLKNVGSSEISLSFKEFRHKARIDRNTSDDEFENLIISTLTKVGAGSFVVDNADQWVMFPLFQKIEVDKKNKKIQYVVSDPFIKYFNDFINKYTAFPLIDFVKIKKKYAKNMYRVFMQYANTGRYYDNFEHFIYEVIGVPKSTKRANIVTKYINPNVKYLRAQIPMFHNLEVSYSKNKKTYVGIEFTWSAVADKYEYIKEESAKRSEKRKYDKEWDEIMSKLK